MNKFQRDYKKAFESRSNLFGENVIDAYLKRLL